MSTFLTRHNEMSFCGFRTKRIVVLFNGLNKGTALTFLIKGGALGQLQARPPLYFGRLYVYWRNLFVFKIQHTANFAK